MATSERISGHVPDWLAASQAGYSLGRNLRKDQDLAKDATDPGLADATYNNPVPTDVGPPEEGMESAQGSSMPVKNAAQPLSPQQRLERRAGVYRQYGDDVEADKMLAANAQLGLVNAQTGEVTQRTSNLATEGQSAQIGLETASRANVAAISQKRIRDQVASQLDSLTDANGQPRDATPEDLFGNQKQMAAKLYAAGHSAAADDVLKQLKSGIDSRISADSTLRKAAAAKLFSQVSAGDYSGLSQFGKQFGYGLTGNSIDDVKPGPQPGTVALTYTDQGGQKTKVVPTKSFQEETLKHLRDALADNPALAKDTYEHVQAQIKQAADAGANSRASAGLHGEQSSEIKQRKEEAKYASDRRKKLDDAYDTPEAERTPAQKAYIQGYSDHVDDSRPARNQPNSRPQVKMNQDGSQTMTSNDGTVWQMARNGKFWQDITPGRPASERKDAMPGGNGQAAAPAAGASRPPLSAFGGR